MDVLFFDRNNKRNVKLSELMPINFVEHPIIVDLESSAMNGQYTPASGDLYFHTKKLGEFGYKSEKCRNVCNWDLAVMESDLIFLEIIK